MSTLTWLGVFVVSLGVLVWASGVLIDNAERIGLRLGMSSFVIGILVVGIGTSIPELVSSIYAALAGETEIVVGNVLGSNITNILLVVGIAGLIGKNVKLERDLLHIDLPMVLGSAILLAFLIYDGTFSRMDAILCVLGAAVYVVSTLVSDDATDSSASSAKKLTFMVWFNLLLALGMVVVGAKYTVDSVVVLATTLGLSTEIIALSAVAFGTSLPEITVAITAVRRGKAELAIGNIIGSNIFNAFAVMGIPGLLVPLVVPPEIISFSLPFFLAVTVLYVIIKIDSRINRYEGCLLLLFYAYFIGHLYQLA